MSVNDLADYVDPELLEDRLPQPFRRIDKVLWQLIEDAMDAAEIIIQQKKLKNQAKENPFLPSCGASSKIPNPSAAVTLAQSGGRLFVGSQEDHLQYWDTSSQQLLDNITNVHTKPVQSLSVSRNSVSGFGEVLVCASLSANQVAVHSFAASLTSPPYLPLLLATKKSPTDTFTRVSLSPESTLVAVVLHNNTVEISNMPPLVAPVAPSETTTVSTTVGKPPAAPKKESVPVATTPVTLAEPHLRISPPILSSSTPSSAPPPPPSSTATTATTTPPTISSPVTTATEALPPIPTVHFVSDVLPRKPAQAVAYVTKAVIVWWQGVSTVVRHSFGDGQPAQTWHLPFGVCRSAVSKKGQHIAFGLLDGSVVVFDGLLGVQKHVLKRHVDSPVTSLAFVADSQYIVSGGADNRALIHEMKKGGLLHVLNESSHIIERVIAAHNELPLALCMCADGHCRVYDVASGKHVGKLTLSAQYRLPTDSDRAIATHSGFAFIGVKKDETTPTQHEVLHPEEKSTVFLFNYDAVLVACIPHVAEMCQRVGQPSLAQQFFLDMHSDRIRTEGTRAMVSGIHGTPSKNRTALMSSQASAPRTRAGTRTPHSVMSEDSRSRAPSRSQFASNTGSENSSTISTPVQSSRGMSPTRAALSSAGPRGATASPSLKTAQVPVSLPTEHHKGVDVTSKIESQLAMRLKERSVRELRMQRRQAELAKTVNMM